MWSVEPQEESGLSRKLTENMRYIGKSTTIVLGSGSRALSRKMKTATTNVVNRAVS